MNNLQESWLRQEGREFFWGKRNLGSLSFDRKRFITHRSKEHFFRKYGGYSLNLELINKLISLNVETIVLFYKTTNKETICYTINPQKVRLIGINVKESHFENQLVVNLKYFDKK